MLSRALFLPTLPLRDNGYSAPPIRGQNAQGSCGARLGLSTQQAKAGPDLKSWVLSLDPFCWPPADSGGIATLLIVSGMKGLT